MTAEGPATQRRVREVARRLVDTLRPVTNALPGGALGSVDPAVPLVKGRWLLGTGGRGRGAWRAFGHDQPSRWAAFVSPPLARSTRVTRVEALDAAGRPVAESDDQISHPVCHIFR